MSTKHPMTVDVDMLFVDQKKEIRTSFDVAAMEH